ncbi:hypothetical protein GCM10027040_30860 [Halomonas shantousis]
MNLTISLNPALIAARLLGFLIFLATATASADTAPDEGEVAEAIRNYHSNLENDQRSGQALTVNFDGLADQNGVVCKRNIPRSEENRDAILASKAYQVVQTYCYQGSDFLLAVELGLVEHQELSPYVSQYTLTGLGRKQLSMRERSNYLYFYFAHDAIENVLQVDSSTNPYGVPTANVRYSTVLTLDDWAKPHEALQASFDRQVRRSRKQYTAHLWETNHGWQVFYIAGPL